MVGSQHEALKPTPWDVLFRLQQTPDNLLPVCFQPSASGVRICSLLLRGNTPGASRQAPNSEFICGERPLPQRLKFAKVPIWLLKRWDLNLRLEHFFRLLLRRRLHGLAQVAAVEQRAQRLRLLPWRRSSRSPHGPLDGVYDVVSKCFTGDLLVEVGVASARLIIHLRLSGATVGLTSQLILCSRLDSRDSQGTRGGGGVVSEGSPLICEYFR